MPEVTQLGSGRTGIGHGRQDPRACVDIARPCTPSVDRLPEMRLVAENDTGMASAWLCDHGEHGSPAGLHCSMGVGFHTPTSPGTAHSSLNHDRSSALGGAERLRQRPRPGTGDALSSALTASSPDEEHASVWRAHPHGSTNFLVCLPDRHRTFSALQKVLPCPS